MKLKSLQISDEARDLWKKLSFAKLAYLVVQLEGDGMDKVRKLGRHPGLCPPPH